MAHTFFSSAVGSLGLATSLPSIVSKLSNTLKGGDQSNDDLKWLVAVEDLSSL